MDKPKVIIVVGLDIPQKDEAISLIRGKKTIIFNFDTFKREMYSGEIKDNSKVISRILKRSAEYLGAGNDVILNIPALKRSVRHGIIQFYRRFDCEIIAYIIAVPFGDGIYSNMLCDKPVEEYKLQTQLRQFEIPFYEEGFDNIIIHNYNNNSNYNNLSGVLCLMSEMQGFDQKNSHHKLDLYNHCKKAEQIFFSDHSVGTDTDRNITIALLLHDIGKLFTRSFGEDGECHYYSHPNVGTYYLLNQSKYINVNLSEFLEILFYVNYHMMPFDFKIPQVRMKYKRVFGDKKYNNLKIINECDKAARG